MGQDVSGACGQLVVSKDQQQKKKPAVIDIEDAISDDSRRKPDAVGFVPLDPPDALWPDISQTSEKNKMAGDVIDKSGHNEQDERQSIEGKKGDALTSGAIGSGVWARPWPLLLLGVTLATGILLVRRVLSLRA
jgi:hypothetical protein